MRKFTGLVVVLIAQAAATLANAQPSSANISNGAATAIADRNSGDQQRVEDAQHQVARNPTRPQSYVELALAFIRLARDTANPLYLKDADSAIAQGLVLAPKDFQLEKARVAASLEAKDYGTALVQARLLNKQVPDDVTAYGYVAEADLAIGNYAEAETSVQWMINMRPNNVAGLILGANLRVLYGDNAGAMEFLNQAFSETPQVDPEQQAYIANKIAELQLNAGQADAASKVLARADEIAPHLQATQMNLARLHMQQQNPLEAVEILQALLSKEQDWHSSTSSIMYLLALAQQQAAQPTAAATYAKFATSADAESQSLVNDNVDLILYWAENGHEPAKALRLAEKQISINQTIWTLDGYAWALYVNGKYLEAEEQIQKALRVGIHSAQISEHAGEIELKLNKRQAAMQDFASALQANPRSTYGSTALRELGGGDHAASVALVVESQHQEVAKTLSTVPSPAETKDNGGVPVALLIPRPTGTDRMIKKTQAQVAAHPLDAGGYSNLGAAFFQRARETGDVEDYQLAEQALNKSLDIVSTDLSATEPLETMAQVCMGEHRFTDALTYAQKALALGSGDLSAFAIVGDAYADMGEYEKAGIAYSRLRPSETAGSFDARQAYAQQTRTAYLTFVAGDVDGAILQMQRAVGEGVQAHLPSENLAWLYFELGEFSYQAGKISAAADAYMTALTVYPGDYRALAGLGKVRASQGRYNDAIILYQSAIAIVPMPVYISELGDIYAATGDATDAQKQYKLVQYIGLLGHINQVLHNRDLALFYADHDMKLDESLVLAHREFEVRSDIYTWDALAWSLYKNGKYQEADESMRHAERLGTRDAMLLFHAGMISAKLGNRIEASRQLNEALTINPSFSVLYASSARKQLAALQPQSAGTLASTVNMTSDKKIAHVQ